MAELTPTERLQPSLLDRLTDEEPQHSQEGRNRRVMSIQRLRESVLRDVAWLLNTTNLVDHDLAENYPLVAQSVLNYGLPDLAGLTASAIDATELEALVRQAIWDFEPRILRHSLKVRAQAADDQMNHNALVFEIEGDLWAQPVPLELFLKTEIDLESGSIAVSEMTRYRRAMDPRLLKYYNRELAHLREMGGEFAAEFPKIAGRLSLDGFECADPYVERLLEGFAFLAARLQARMDAEFPRFTHHLFEMVYPQYVSPTPSIAVVQLVPDLKEGTLAGGFVVPRHSSLMGLVGKGEATAAEYRTAHDVTLFPLELVEAQYVSRDSAGVELPDVPGVKAAIRLRLRATAGLPLSKIKLDRLPIFIRGTGELPMRIYEQVVAGGLGVALRPTERPAPWQMVLPQTSVHSLGFDDEQALLPYGPRSFQGYRLLAEYFACPQRFMFVELTGLAPAAQRSTSKLIDVFILLDRYESQLEPYVSGQSFALFCTPAVNLFPKTADRIHLTDQAHEHHVVPDRTRPLDFEVYSVTEVAGYGTTLDEEQPFLPFYAARDQVEGGVEQRAYYTLLRAPRILSTNQKKFGPRSSYVGSEVYLALVDGDEAPFRHDLRQLAVSTLCTNRDLALHMPIGKSTTDFTLETGAPVESVRCLAGPTRPRPAPIFSDGDFVWRLVSHLTLNYLSLVNNDERQGAAAIRDLLKLYGDAGEAAIRKQIEGVRNVASQTITRRIPTPGPITFGRGLEISITCDEAAFEGTGIFLLGAVLEQFLARYVSINSFTETVLKSVDRGEVMRWPARIGRRQIA